MNAQFNSNQPENQIISEVMSDNTKGNNRQARFVLMMFENEVSYSADAIANVFRKSGRERTELVEETLSDISDSFATVWEQRNHLDDRRKDKNVQFSTAEALQLEAANSKIKAARELFIRALTSVYHLRKIEAFGVKFSKSNGALSYYFYVKSDSGEQELDPKGNPVSSQLTVSGNALYRSGSKDIDKDFGRKTQTKKNGAPNAARDGVAPVADVVTNRVRKARAEGKFIEDMSDDEEKAIEALLRELMIAKFADDHGEIDRDALNEYVNTVLKNTGNNGKDKPKAEAKSKTDKAEQPAAA